MGCRGLLRSAMIVEPFLSHPCNLHFNLNRLYHIPSRSRYNSNKLTHIAIGAREFHPPKPALSCSRNETTPSKQDDVDEDPPQEAVLKRCLIPKGGLAKLETWLLETLSLMIPPDEWLALDQKVNSYPSVRGFTAIGTGGDDFVQAMVVAVESVIQQPIPQGCVKQKSSSGGKYVSVNIGPIQVVSSEQVQAVYNAMRSDDRMKYFL